MTMKDQIICYRNNDFGLISKVTRWIFTVISFHDSKGDFAYSYKSDKDINQQFISLHVFDIICLDRG